MTNPPSAALPVLELIATKVKRPSSPPQPATGPNSSLRWKRVEMVVDGPKGEKHERIRRFCPLGLLPGTLNPTPWSAQAFGGSFPAPESAISAFVHWWDSLRAADAEEAVWAIWGEDKLAVRRAIRAGRGR